ncbi:hypothetical protein [Natrarchaeobaculum aegyptiacum]|uniref:Uncharacterized protein n=1 Tax=Natrarchaeobaculum aegyptiacum TaxID=745377 RepID=A0A2Z2HUD3_9EURY|nr:hypothetical protein [Natrarchaeobaculum aegyptiacum]ARS90770.1 hypothetical protein B1756_14245 [Natrarchaeobaculum aegyptiacum]
MTYSAIADVTTAIVELLREHAAEAATPLDPSGIEAVAPDAVDSLSGLELAVYPYRIATDNRGPGASLPATHDLTGDLVGFAFGRRIGIDLHLDLCFGQHRDGCVGLLQRVDDLPASNGAN